MRTCNRADVYAAIDDERKYQNLKWGSIEDHPHEVGAWLTIMRSILTDAESAWSSLRGDNGALDELRKLAAVGVACMEQHGVVLRSRLCFMNMNNGERCGVERHGLPARARQPETVETASETEQDR